MELNLLILTFFIGGANMIQPIPEELQGTPRCHKNGCKFYNKFLVPPPPKIVIEKTSVVGKFVQLGSTNLCGHRAEQQRNRRYCSYSLMHSNLDCETWTKDKGAVTQDVMEAMVATDSCKVGKWCFKGGNCYGADSLICKEKEQPHVRSIKNGAVDAGFDGDETPWENMFYDTCEQSWSCAIESVCYPLKTKHEEGKKKFIVDILGTEREVQPDKPLFEFIDGWNYLLNGQSLGEGTINLKCLMQRGERLCIAEEKRGSIEKGSVLQFDSQCLSHGKNWFVQIQCQEEWNEEMEFGLYLKDIKSPNNATALETTLRIAQMILFNNMQGVYNSLVLSEEIQKIQVLLKDMILAISKENDFFLPAMLKQSGMTTWVNDSTVRVCPCETGFAESASNCMGSRTFKKGTWHVSSPDDLCVHSEEVSEPQNLTLISQNHTIAVSTLSMPELVATSDGRVPNIDSLLVPDKTDRGTDSEGVAELQRMWIISKLFNFIDFLRRWSFIAAYLSLAIIWKNSSFSLSGFRQYSHPDMPTEAVALSNVGLERKDQA